MARALTRLKRYSEAIELLEASLRGSLEAANLYVTHAEVRLALAEAYARAGLPEAAARELAWVEHAWSRSDPFLRPRLADVARLVADRRR